MPVIMGVRERGEAMTVAQCDHEWVQTAPNQKRCRKCGLVLTFA
jgi:hypothetical protein